MLAIGAALLVGGWGTTRYVHEQQQGRTEWKYQVWFGDPDHGHMASRVIYGGGVLGMAIGAGLIGFAVLRPTNRS